MPRYLFLWVGFIALLAPSYSNAHSVPHAEEAPFVASGVAEAPLDISKKENSIFPLTVGQRKDLLDEFRALVHMGLRPVSYDRWEGKSMSDCIKAEKPQDRWTLRCEIITGQGSGFYYFYPSSSGQTALLEDLDIHVDASDEKLLDDFRRPIQDLFGRASYVDKPKVQAKPSGLIRRWSNGNDTAELFIDHSSRAEGVVRFVWMRSALNSSAQAWLQGTNKDN